MSIHVVAQDNGLDLIPKPIRVVSNRFLVAPIFIFIIDSDSDSRDNYKSTYSYCKSKKKYHYSTRTANS